jgi:RHO1 GDP-GTP exchange protein 1/2
MQNGVFSSTKEASVQGENGRLFGKDGRLPLVSTLSYFAILFVVDHAAAFHYPYVIAFEPNFIEVWDIITCRIQQVIPGDNLRCLFAEPPPSGSHPAPPPIHYHPHAMPPPPHQLPPGPMQYNVHSNGPIPYYPPGPQPGFPPGGPSMHQNHPMIPPQHLQGIPPQSVSGFSPAYGFGRREILLVSDESVMFLKRASSPPSADGAPMLATAPV